MKPANLLILGAAAAALAASSIAQAQPPAPRAAPAEKPRAATADDIIATPFRFGASGPVIVYRGSTEPDRFVVYVSGDGGWNPTETTIARAIAGMDATVVGVDFRRYLSGAEAAKGSTIYPAGDFSELAQAVQKSLGFARYHRPVIVGYSAGATLAYGTLAQSPSGIFQGGIGMGFCPDLKSNEPLAAGDGKLTHRPDPKLGFVYGPSKSLTARFVALQGDQDLACPPAPTHAFIDQVPNSQVVDLPKLGHGYNIPASWAPQFAQALASLYARPAAPVAPNAVLMRTSMTVTPSRVMDLPLVEVPAEGAGDTLAVFYSGDGGWAGIDRGLADGLVQAGVPVVGYDSLKYFWNRKTPDQAADDLTAVIEHYMAVWHKSRVVIAGYSFGADALPMIVSHLSPEIRARVRLVALVGLDKDGELEFHPTDWLNQSSKTAYSIGPVLTTMKSVPSVCIYGSEDKEDACPSFGPGLIRGVQLKGGHHFNGDYASLGQAVLRAAG